MFPPSGATADSPTATIEVPSDAKGYAEWRQTGKLPNAESAPATKSSEASSVDADEGEGDQASGTAADSETGKSVEHKPSKAERRLSELLEDLKRAGLSPKELKTFKREAAAAAAAEGDSKPKVASERADKAPAELKAPTKPKESDFKTWEEYEAARDQYHEDLSEFKARTAVAEDRAERQREASEREMTERLNQAKTRYKDDNADKTIVSAAKEIFAKETAVPAVIRQVMNESPVLVDVLYTLGKDADGLEEFLETCKTAPGQAMRKLILIEKLVQEELETGGKAEKPAAGEETPERGSDGKFASSKKETKAPPPPRETSGRSSAPPDEVKSAVDAGDFAKYRDAANRRDLARRQGR